MKPMSPDLEVAVLASSPWRSRPAGSSSRPSPAVRGCRSRRPRRAAGRCRRRRGWRSRSTGSGRPIVPVNSPPLNLVGGGDRRGFREAVAFRDGRAGQRLPALGDRALHRHAAAQRQHQRLEIELAEVLVVEQRVEQRVEAREDVERVLCQFLDEAGNVARIGDEQVLAPCCMPISAFTVSAKMW